MTATNFLLKNIGKFFLRSAYYPFYIFLIGYLLRKIHNIKIHIAMFERYIFPREYSSFLVLIEKFREEIRIALMSKNEHMIFVPDIGFRKTFQFSKYTLRERRECLNA